MGAAPEGVRGPGGRRGGAGCAVQHHQTLLQTISKEGTGQTTTTVMTREVQLTPPLAKSERKSWRNCKPKRTKKLPGKQWNEKGRSARSKKKRRTRMLAKLPKRISLRKSGRKRSR